MGQHFAIGLLVGMCGGCVAWGTYKGNDELVNGALAATCAILMIGNPKYRMDTMYGCFVMVNYCLWLNFRDHFRQVKQ